MEKYLVLKKLGFKKLAKSTYIKTRQPDITDVVSSRLALEGSRIPKNVSDAKTYANIKNIPYVGSKAKQVAIDKAKIKHKDLFNTVLKNEKPDTVEAIADKTLAKLLLPTSRLKNMHTVDSLKYVKSGKTYPKELDAHYQAFKKTEKYKQLIKGQ